MAIGEDDEATGAEDGAAERGIAGARGADAADSDADRAAAGVLPEQQPEARHRQQIDHDEAGDTAQQRCAEGERDDADAGEKESAGGRVDDEGRRVGALRVEVGHHIDTQTQGGDQHAGQNSGTIDGHVTLLREGELNPTEVDESLAQPALFPQHAAPGPFRRVADEVARGLSMEISVSCVAGAGPEAAAREGRGDEFGIGLRLHGVCRRRWS